MQGNQFFNWETLENRLFWLNISKSEKCGPPYYLSVGYDNFLGRFEIKTDDGSKSCQRPLRAGTGTTEETVTLMPIQEQDERGDTVTSLSQIPK